MGILVRGARVVVEQGKVLPRADVLTEGDRIARIAPSIPPDGCDVIEAAGRVFMAGFVDCHTHACFVGERLDEWAMKRRGATYLEILKKGGGIMSTVRAVRAATREQLAEALRGRLDIMLREGTTTVEVKSGYGLTAEHELKMLDAIQDAARGWDGTVVMTALLGHAIDPDVEGFCGETMHRTLDMVHERFPGIAVDVFCEKGAWGVEDSVRLLERARSLGHPVRAHVDQFTSMGMVEAAVGMGAATVDHLEASGDATLERVAGSWRGLARGTVAVGLPVCGFHVDGRYARLGEIGRKGGRIAVATNFNPGSAPSSSMPLAMALAVRHCGLDETQAIAGGTEGGALALGLGDRGRIAEGLRADLVLLRHRDERMLVFEVGGNAVEEVIVGGRRHRGIEASRHRGT